MRTRLLQVRVEELAEGVVHPTELSECCFEICQRHQYTERLKFNAELARHGMLGGLAGALMMASRGMLGGLAGTLMLALCGKNHR